MKSLCFRLLTASLSLIASILLTTPARADTLTGDTVFGTLTILGGVDYILPFTSPAVVGPGVEFTGLLHSSGVGLTWDVGVDLSANGFTVAISWPFRDDGTIGNSFSPPIYEITLSDLPPFVQGFTLTSYTCDTSVNPGCLPGGGNGLMSNTFSGSAVTLDFNTLGVGQTYTFADVTAPVATPEPSSLALFGTGALALAAAFRRKLLLN